MRYMRIIPRDLFNEAKLLKCMGRLALLVHDNLIPEGLEIEIVPDVEGAAFRIEKDENDGGLFISNYDVFINDELVYVKAAYNSKSNYSLLCETNEDTVFVFDEGGNFSKEFIEMWIKQKE